VLKTYFPPSLSLPRMKQLPQGSPKYGMLPSAGHRAQSTGRRAQGTEHRAQGTGHRAQGTGHRAQSKRLRNEGTARLQDRKTARQCIMYYRRCI